MSNTVTKFEVGTLDLSGITDEDLKTSTGGGQKPQYLKKPGQYILNITETKLYEGRTDGAGKKWGAALVKCTEQETGRLFSFFVDIPVESLIYTSGSGSTSKVKAQIFTNLLTSVTGKDISTSDLPGMISDITTILAPGSSLKANLDYTKDYVKGHYDKENDTGHFTLRLVGGSDMVDPISGDVLTFSDYDSAVAHYSQVKGFKPAGGMNVKSFLRNNG